ncbi:Nse4 C-terminal [Fragilaria crotonensis]|nr:Nse4 C-terminal [Fragilaria crotonensis]
MPKAVGVPSEGAASNRRKQRLSVMENSGQTDAQRRELRQSLRELNKKIQDNADELADATSSKFEKMRHKNNILWDQVRYTREAVLDGDNLDFLATRAARQVDKLVEVPRYDAIRFCTKLKTKLSSNRAFDWRKLGAEVGVCFNALPSNIKFLAGPLHSDYTPKERKKAERRNKQSDSDNEEEEKPEEVKIQEKDADKLSAVEQNIRTVSDVLTKKSKEERKRLAEECNLDELEPEKRQRVGEVGAIEYLFNPKSFTQTVENIFHFSFLLKEGRASIYKTNDKGPMVQPHPQVADHRPCRQSIISINMRDWRRLSETYNVTKSLVPHRTGSKHGSRLQPSSQRSVSS